MSETFDRAILATIERAAARGWPALETEIIDGWLARASSGGSTRANTVSALDWSGHDLDASIAKVAAFYVARRAKPKFTITDVAEPAGLDAALAARGWAKHGEHVTMAKPVGSAVAPGPIDVDNAEAPSPDWYRVYLQGLTPNRREVAPRIVNAVPAPRVFFSGMLDGKVTASGLSVVDDDVASIQCMATLPEARRVGAARAVLGAIEANAAAHGVKWLYLQAEAENTPAIRLYRSRGFQVAGHYHTRELER